MWRSLCFVLTGVIVCLLLLAWQFRIVVGFAPPEWNGLLTPVEYTVEEPDKSLGLESVMVSLSPTSAIKPQPIGERLTCEIFEELVAPRKVVRNLRPDFLRNPKTGRALELDCYCPELKLAVEYNGIQHYQFPHKYHTSLQKFEEQRFRDHIKRQLCDSVGVYLIPVPCLIDHVEIRNGIYVMNGRTAAERRPLILKYLQEMFAAASL